MHILTTTSAAIDELAEPVDLRQAPAPLVVLSFTESDLAGLAAAWQAERSALPALRLVQLGQLRHPMSVDLWIDRTFRHAEMVVLRLLGGLDWWRYGAEQLAEAARAQGVKLAVLPGEDGDDPRLAALGTVTAQEKADLLGYFRAGGQTNLRALLRRMAGLEAPPPARLPMAAFWQAQRRGRPTVPILFYRSMLLAEDAAPIAALAAALDAQGLDAVPIYVASLKQPESLAFLRAAMADLKPALVVTTTAFASGDAAALGAPGVPLIQAVMATTPRTAWSGSPRGLGGADLAMHVALPELDGRVLGGVLGFKDAAPGEAEFGLTRQVNRPEPDRVAQVAARVAALIRLQSTPRAERRIALLIPDYPGAGGRAGYAVGLDVPASVLLALRDLSRAGYAVGGVPETPRDLMADLEVTPADHRVVHYGNIVVAIAPDRGLAKNRRAEWHDPVLPPRPELLAFGAWLQAHCDAVVHMGAHGAIEWLPGKAVALTGECYPERVLGALPVIYPFLVSNPGEAAQAKRRIAAVTLGHLPPRLAGMGLTGRMRDLERLLDEYAAADGLDRRRRERLVPLILAHAGDHVPPGEDVLKRLDAWLCDVKELAIKDGLHVFGRAAPEDDADRAASAAAEATALIAALDGRFIPAGPGGAPARGRRDVLPTGRNLTAADPRGLPTETAFDLGRLAAEEVVRLHLQEQGEMPRAMVQDLWASATLRSGGEEIATGMALMGCRPVWDEATGRVTGVEVLPPAVMGRPRVDVTFRLSGLFRDLFPAQIALLDAATRAVAARDETASENPLAAAGSAPLRVFGAAPGAYGAGIEAALASGDWSDRDELGRAYLAGASHAYGGAAGDATPAEGAFAARVAVADALVHGSDDPGRDFLEGGADAAHLGGFASAAKLLGGAPLLISLDTTDPNRPRARPLAAQLARLVQGRISEKFIAGQMRHGPRGASEFAETVDRLVAFAESTECVPDTALDAVHDAYLGDPAVLAFLERENPAALRAIALRFAQARRRGVWHPRRNGVDAGLGALLGEGA